MLQTLLTQSFHTTIEQSANTYQHGYFITFVRRQYSNYNIKQDEVIHWIKNIINDKDLKFYIFKVVNIGDPDHYDTVHYHCIVFSNKKPFMNSSKIKETSKSMKITINMKNIYNITGLLGYINDQHKILKIYTSNQLLKPDMRRVTQKLETKPILYFSFITLKIIRGRCYVPT